jgi:hypothetical protein
MMEVPVTQTINEDQTRGETVSKEASHMLIFQFFLSWITLNSDALPCASNDMWHFSYATVPKF